MDRNKNLLGKICKWAVYGGLALMGATTVATVIDENINYYGVTSLNSVAQSKRESFQKRVPHFYTPLIYGSAITALVGSCVELARRKHDDLEKIVW